MNQKQHDHQKSSISEVEEEKKTKKQLDKDQKLIVPEKKRIKKTKKQLEQSLEKAQADSEKFKTQLAYLQAEHENYIKSMERREAKLRLQANRDLILDLLPVLDDLERAQIMVPQIDANEPFIGGLKMVIDNLKHTLEKAGVKPINCEGKPFDPLRHDVIVKEETTTFLPNTVIEELRKGYLLKGTLLRPSMVKIAIKPSKSIKTTDQHSKKEKKGV